MSTTVADLLVSVRAAGVEQTKAGLGAVQGLLGGFPVVGAVAGAGIAAGLVIGGAAAIKMAGDFQESMTELVTGAGESKANLGLVSAGVLQMARDTGQSTQQLAAGLYTIESAGYHGQAGLDVLTAAAKGAKVGNADLGVTADAVTTIMTDFASKHVTAAQAVNTLTGIVSLGKTHMQDLAGALSAVLPAAANAHVSLNDVAGAMATMTGSGVPAADAATYLRQMLTTLSSPSAAAQKALLSVGLSAQQVKDDIASKGLPATLQEITTAIGTHLPAGSVAAAEAFKNIAGGSKQMQAMLDLTGTHMQTFQANVGNVASIVKQGGASIVGWKDVQGDFNTQMSRAKEVLETAAISIGTKLLPVATAFIGFVADNAIPALSKFVGWITGSSTSAEILRPVLAGVAIVIAGALVAGFVAWAVAAGAAAIATIAATWPVLAIGAGIALLITGIVLLVSHWKQVTAFLSGEWRAITGTVQLGLHALGDDFGALGSRIQTFVGNVVGWFGSLPGKLAQAGHDMIQGLINGITGMAGNLASALGGVIHGAVASLPGGAQLAHLAGLPGFASGVSNFAGGLALVGEGGPELAFLPSGSSVLPAQQTANVLGGSGGGRIGPVHIHVHVAGRHVGEAILPDIVKSLSIATGDRAH